MNGFLIFILLIDVITSSSKINTYVAIWKWIAWFQLENEYFLIQTKNTFKSKPKVTMHFGSHYSRILWHWVTLFIKLVLLNWNLILFFVSYSRSSQMIMLQVSIAYFPLKKSKKNKSKSRAFMDNIVSSTTWRYFGWNLSVKTLNKFN